MSTENPSSDPIPASVKESSPKVDFSATVIIQGETAVDQSAANRSTAPDAKSVSPVDASSVLPATAAVATAPAFFGRYEVKGTLGTGGFGSVYLGHDGELDRLVAIKVLHSRPNQLQTATDEFLEEARKLAKLRHPGIVTVHDVGMHEASVYLVSDYLDGPDLAELLNDNRLVWQEAARIAAAVADALAHAHERLIVHRDVKPANIILTSNRTPVLVDFGLALDESKAGGSEKGVVAGTPWYLSPEQATGAAHRIDGRTDVYSLGVVLYQMLTGRVPFRASNPAELLRQVRDDEPQPPRQLVQGIPPQMERACLRALAKQQKDRYSTASDFAEELRSIITTESSASWQTAPIEIPISGLHAPVSSLTSFTRSRILSESSSRRMIRDAERRQVTVLFCGCDAFDSDTFLELDAEDQAKATEAFQQTCEEAISRYGGTVVQRDQNGLLVCFGYPVAFEDAPRRATLSGLGILADLAAARDQFRQNWQLELDPWVGLHTGPAVVEIKEDTVSLAGEARNVAVRLGDVATAGSVFCSEATHRLIHGEFQCSSLGTSKIKGVSQPLEFFHVHEFHEDRSPIEVAESAGLTPLTGRDHEINLLKDRWEQAQEGSGQAVLLTGEPGLGKSRLVHSLKEGILAESNDTPVVVWRCSPHFQNTSLHPAINFFERTLGFSREEPSLARFNRLMRHLEQHDLATPDGVPHWASLLSLPVPSHLPASTLSPVRQREETFRVMLDWFRARAGQAPVLFIIEDLHWMDASTLDFLGQFLSETLHEPILTLLTFRPEFQTPWPSFAHQTSLGLNRLTRRQVEEVMRRKMAAAPSPQLVEQVYDRTSGVPLFVEEFLKMMQESGMLNRADSTDSDSAPLLSREIPATLQDLVMARLDRMDGERDVAQMGAVLGREFSYELLGAVTELDEPTLQAQLARLVQAEILYSKGRPPRCTYIFKHALMEDSLYNTLIKSKRQQFHQKVADTLESRFPQVVDSHPELLAHHCSEGNDHQKAVSYWLKAGQRSHARFANVEAISHLTRGLTLLKTLAESPERNALELAFLNPLGTAYIAVKGFGAAEVGPVYEQARQLCELSGQPAQLFAILWGTWIWNVVRADLKLCLKLSDEAVALAERVNDPGILMEALFLPSVTQSFRGEFAAAHAHCQRAIANYDDRERTRFWAGITGQDAGVAHRCYLAVASWHLGQIDKAFQQTDEALELARSIGHPFTLAFALEHRAWLYNQCRMANEAQAVAEEEIAIAKEQGFAYWLASATLFKAGALVLQGKAADALPMLLKGLQDLAKTGTNLDVTFHLGFLGLAYHQAGQLDESLRSFDEALAVAARNDERFYEAELYRLKGELLLARLPSDAAMAEECFHKAIEIARRQHSKTWELRATVSLARLWQTQARREEAYEQLARIYGDFKEGFATPDLVEAKRLLETLT